MGEYAGRARYLPGDTLTLTPLQQSAVGRVVEVHFMGITAAGSGNAECLYQEAPGHDVVGATLIRERDLDFINDPLTGRK
jgi:hypothetical protein